MATTSYAGLVTRFFCEERCLQGQVCVDHMILRSAHNRVVLSSKVPRPQSTEGGSRGEFEEEAIETLFEGGRRGWW